MRISRDMKAVTDGSVSHTLKRTKYYVGIFVRCATLLCLLLHFTLTTLYVGPLNPIKMKMQPILNATIGTYFPQDWTFFAPDPVDVNFYVLVQPLTQKNAMAKNGIRQDGWCNLNFSRLS